MTAPPGGSARLAEATASISDFCDGVIRELVQRDGRFLFGRSLGARLDGVASFAEDAGGELFVLSVFKGVYRLEQG